MADGNIKLNGVLLNIEKAIKRVRLDMKDDWFQDPLRYEDILTQEFVTSKFKSSKDNCFEYKVGSAIHIDIPKPGFTIRYSTEINIIDRVYFQALVDVISDELDKLHSNRIYSHRINKERSDEKYFFKYAVPEWKKFISHTELELNSDNNNVLLLTDLTNFYENIGILDLYNELNTLAKDLGEEYRLCIRNLKEALENWSIRNTKRGIPQNRDASAFIANLYLHTVDDTMIKAGFNYYRYMDDIRIVCKDRFEARRALKRLISELRNKGQNVNSKKTQILEFDNPDDRNKIEESFSKTDRKIEQIDALLKSRTAREVQIAVPMLKAKVISLIENKISIEREFRYCVNRLERIARNEVLAAKIDFDPITDRIIKELIDQPWSTDTFARYLGSVTLSGNHLNSISSFLTDEEKNIFEWQGFYLWGILSRHKYKSDSLIRKARKNIEDKVADPILASSSLYLAVNGAISDRKFIAERFKDFNNHFTQRFALISVKDFDFVSVVKPYVKDYVIDCYDGCYSILSKNYSNQFLHPIERLNDEDIYADLPDDIS